MDIWPSIYGHFPYCSYIPSQETKLYYLQSRYYNPEIGRFINADSYASTGQGILGNNMFAYCQNNPVTYSDSKGQAVDLGAGLSAGALLFTFVDGPLPIADFLIGLLLTVELCSQLANSLSVAPISKVNQNIDWEKGDKNHILKGTKGKHIPGWNRMGIDPNDDKSWALVLPILKEVVEKADRILTTTLPNGSQIVQYYKLYAAEGVNIVVKIWLSIDDLIEQLSDAIPYII